MIDQAAIEALTEEIAAELRGIGLHHPDITAVETPDGQVAFVVDALIGDLAFSDRVQRPADQDDIDAEFAKLTGEQTANEFLDRRADLQRRIDEGRPLFDPPDQP